ncbi:expansion [Leptinotarsa decemlineata]|uniref:expansion n=1 Tax=Leptinotarsa decemlineata TaxID=7539 RepID=UPI003D305348
MVSRRKILSRSRDDLHMDSVYQPPEEEEDVWYQKEKLYRDHIQEVLNKWTQIDDEIWAKVIVFERNRRVAKAYARAPVLTVNDSDDGFDGFRIGLCGFENPMRDQKTEEYKRHIGHGVKIKMDDAGNILIKRVSKCNVYIKNTAQESENAIGNEIFKIPNCALEPEKPVKLFDMKKFQSNVNRELRRAYPDRRRLECQCLSAIAFVKVEPELLECPIWVMIINIVALDMLKSKLPPVQRVMDIKNRPRIPIPDEDPYSIAVHDNGHFGTSNYAGGSVAATREQLLLQSQHHNQRRSDKPPKLPPREKMYPQDIPQPDYDDYMSGRQLKTLMSAKDKERSNDNKKFDEDPYYCGLRTRVPNFIQRRSDKPPKLPPRENMYPHDIPKPDYDDNVSNISNNWLKPFGSSRGKEKSKDNKQYEDPYYCGLRARVPNFVAKLKGKDSVPMKRFSISQQSGPTHPK